MPALDVADETFILAPEAELHDIFCDEQAWKKLGLTLHCYEDRGDKGKRWTLSDTLTGTAEVWLEPTHGGVNVHVYLQADAASRQSGARLKRRYARPVKRWILEVKAGYDNERPAGTAPVVHAKISAQADRLQTEPNREVSSKEG